MRSSIRSQNKIPQKKPFISRHQVKNFYPTGPNFVYDVKFVAKRIFDYGFHEESIENFQSPIFP